MQIGLLQCGHFPEVAGFPTRTYSDLYSEMLAGQGLTFRTWSVVDMEFPDTVSDAEGWLISGSRHGAYDDLPFIPPLEDFIREAYSARVPMVGICFGHQIIAQALGGKVEKWEGGWRIGRTQYDFDGEVLNLNAWHQDQVVTPPPEAEVTATSDFCRYAGFRYKGPAMSVQPHPEFDRDAVDLLLTARAPGLVPDEMIAEAEANKGKGDDNDAMADRVAAFFKENRHG
ncbi:MAG: type 1 glutamine amidotransferase [Silicimonas sp.]|nr:type 1 glutamine amidotransferase [Silicimonas sp.]NND42518.1 type 1 glutamine amidotransferase [Silicimonas sp.]